MYIFQYRDSDTLYEVVATMREFASMLYILNTSDFVLEFAVKGYSPKDFHLGKFEKWVEYLSFME